MIGAKCSNSKIFIIWGREKGTCILYWDTSSKFGVAPKNPINISKAKCFIINYLDNQRYNVSSELSSGFTPRSDKFTAGLAAWRHIKKPEFQSFGISELHIKGSGPAAYQFVRPKGGCYSSEGLKNSRNILTKVLVRDLLNQTVGFLQTRKRHI